MTSELLRLKLEHTEDLERLARRAAQTQAELTKAVLTASRDGLSNREIARAAGLSHPTIAKMLDEPARYGGASQEQAVERANRIFTWNCRTCGAQAGERCRTPRGAETEPHATRRRDAALETA